MNLVTIILIFVVSVTVSFCFSDKKTDEEINHEKRQCVNRGIQYYQDIGSFPHLSDGRLAWDVVREKCSRSHLSF